MEKEPITSQGLEKLKNELIELKNLFKRAKLRTDIDQAITAFEYYQIPDNMRPDVLAKNLYDNPELDDFKPSLNSYA